MLPRGREDFPPLRHSARGRLCTLEHADLIIHGVNNPVKLRTITRLVLTFMYVCSFSFLFFFLLREKNAVFFFFFFIPSSMHRPFYSKPKNKVVLLKTCVAVAVSNNKGRV